MRVRVMIAVGVSLGALTLVGCDPVSAVTDSGSGSPAGAGKSTGGSSAGGSSSDKPSTEAMSNEEICAKALGTVTLSEIGDDVHRKADEARDTASVLHTLASQTQDHSLQDALNAAAGQAGQEIGQAWSAQHLQQWASREEAYFDDIRKVC